MTSTNVTPLQYHMNDLVFYLGLSVGGTIDKQIAILERIGAMATGMKFDPKGDPKVPPDIAEFAEAAMFLRQRYYPALDANPFLVPQIRRMKIAVNVVSARAFFLVSEYKLITGNLMRERLISHFGKDKYKGDLDEYA